jgi:hypothetical protein
MPNSPTNTGQSLLDKVEGLVLARDVPNTAYVVIDRDDATSASELCTVALARRMVRVDPIA